MVQLWIMNKINFTKYLKLGYMIYIFLYRYIDTYFNHIKIMLNTIIKYKNMLCQSTLHETINLKVLGPITSALC